MPSLRLHTAQTKCFVVLQNLKKDKELDDKSKEYLYQLIEVINLLASELELYCGDIILENPRNSAVVERWSEDGTKA